MDTLAKLKHKECKAHLAVGKFDGKKYRKVCVLRDDTPERIEESVTLAEYVSERL